MDRGLALVGAIAAAFLIAWVAARPPAPAGPEAPAAAFSASRALADIRQIARAPHVTGSAEDARVRAYLAERLRGLGLAVETQTGTLTPRGRRGLARWRGDATAAPVNVIGVLPGQDRAAPAVVLMAHHDTVAGSPGAADDSAGVAAILETVRALRAGPPPRRDVAVVFTDAEELDSSGAAAFFASHPLAGRIGAVINLEARGGGGRALMFETGAADGPMMGLFAGAVGQPTASSAAVLVYRLLPNYTDFTLAKARGLAGFNLAFLGRPGLYHAAQATPDAIDLGSVQHMGAETLDLAHALAQAPQLPGKGADAAFADLFGLKLLLLPAWAGWVVLAAAGALFAAAAARSGALRWREVLRGSLEALGLVLVAAGLLTLANQVSGAGPHANYFGRLAEIPWLEAQAVLICLGVAALLATRAPRGGGLASRWLGFAVPPFIAALAVQALAPTAAPVLAWPLLLAALGAAVAARLDPDFARPGAQAVLVAAAALGVGWILTLAHLAFLAVGADLPGGMAAFLLLAAVLLRPLPAPPRLGAGAAVALVLLGFGMAVAVRLSPPAPTIPVYARG